MSAALWTGAALVYLGGVKTGFVLAVLYFRWLALRPGKPQHLTADDDRRAGERARCPVRP